MSFVWSYTAIETFHEDMGGCPRRFHHRFILKEKEPETPQQRAGIAAHKYCEAAVKSDQPQANALVESVRRAGQNRKLWTELKMGLKQNGNSCGFFETGVWGRTAADVLIVDYPNALLFDWKTGKVKEKDTQLMTMAAFIFKAFPRVDSIVACNIWLAANKVGKAFTFPRTQESSIWQWLLPRIHKIERAIESKNFPERPGALCGWCPVKACQHNRA